MRKTHWAYIRALLMTLALGAILFTMYLLNSGALTDQQESVWNVFWGAPTTTTLTNPRQNQ